MSEGRWICRPLKRDHDDFDVQTHEESERRKRRDLNCISAARKYGYLPPPREKDCPPKPANGLCECCGERVKRWHFDHCHETGAFRGWVCRSCNTRGDDIEQLEKRVAFLKAHKKKERIARIRAVHLKVVSNGN